MFNLKNEILELKLMSPNKISSIVSLDEKYPAFLYRGLKDYGVFILYNGNLDVLHKFSKVSLSTVYSSDYGQKVLYLSIPINEDLSFFASIAESFLSPENREIIQNNPYEWCDKWSELLGNTKVNKLITDVVAELYVYNHLLSNFNNVIWGASNKTSNDFQLPNFNVEVKSTTLKFNSLITINSKFQLQGETPVYLYFCRLENIPFKYTIDSLVEELVKKGVSREYLEIELSNLNYPKGIKERQVSFEILELRSYKVEKEVFPLITLENLNEIAHVSNIVNFKLDLDLNGIEYERIK